MRGRLSFVTVRGRWHRVAQTLVQAVLVVLVLTAASPPESATPPRRRPNVVLIMTDDQGYGDLAAHGNTMIRTPNMDRLHARSVRLTDFHVDPTCSPTRSALMTGRYSTRTGVWHTIAGRSLMRAEEVTMAEALAGAGYRTAMFGKWHLGDTAPLRAEDQGFQDVLRIGGGGVGQTPDYWGNDYFDDTYFRNARPTTFRGYCTDVWFDNALRFMTANRDRPFFAYIATNVPHGPYNVAEKYARPYIEQGVSQPMANFYGMITNIDENLGRLLVTLDDLGLADDTVLIFMTDNGTAAGLVQEPKAGVWPGFNANMRGQKGSPYEGGHRVPCFIRYPSAGIGGGRDVDVLTAHVDLLPTLLELCGVAKPPGPPIDGRSLVPLLTGGGIKEWPDRTLFVHSQRIEHPEKWRQCSVMTERWRLVNGTSLYEIQADPGQKHDIAKDHPRVVSELRAAYEGWWQSLSDQFDEYVPITIGLDDGPTWITCHDWHPTENQVPWNQRMVQRTPNANGFWALEVARAGRYRFTLRQQPAPAGCPIAASAARVAVGTAAANGPVANGATAVCFELNLPAGPSRLTTTFTDSSGHTRGAFFVEVERLSDTAGGSNR